MNCAGIAFVFASVTAGCVALGVTGKKDGTGAVVTCFVIFFLIVYLSCGLGGGFGGH